MTRKPFLTVALLLALLATATTATAQWSQTTACPGWNNPQNFSTGSSMFEGVKLGYSGEGGTKNSSLCPNVMTGVTGANSMGPTYTTAQMDAGVGSGGCNNAALTIPLQSSSFAIMTNTTGTDPNTSNRLKYVPTEYNTPDGSTNLTRSIRVGDGCANGGQYGVASLYYTMRVTSQNAMLYIYYAIVAQAPGHGMPGNPAFIIRVRERTSSGNWSQISDTLAYYITTTPVQNGGSANCDYMERISPVPLTDRGWHSATPGTFDDPVYYKDWEKVAINLTNYINEFVQVQVMIYDCSANYHFAYAYIAGECRPMQINTAGCPPGLSTDVATLTAPRGMQNYVWYASEWGVADDPPAAAVMPGGENDYFTFRRLTPEVGTEESGAYEYPAQADDFRVSRRRNDAGTTVACDSVGNRQTFMCEMTSALDPAKPFVSRLYTNVTNTKPSMEVDSILTCEGDVKINNLSQVPGDPTLVDLAQTSWKYYDNASCLGDPILEYVGDSIVTHFDDSEVKGLLVRTQTIDPTCYSEAIYPIKPRINPKAGMTLSRRVLCDEDQVVIIDTTSSTTRRVWYFLPEDAESSDEELEAWTSDSREIMRSFTHSVEPIRLEVYNGLYTLYRGDTTWCSALAHDTVAVFLHPELEVTGDTLVCEGGTTDVSVRAVGVDSCSYYWSLTLGEVTGNLPEGPNLAVAPYADKSTYYVKVVSPQGCVAWDSLHAYLVRPKLYMIPEDGRICPGSTATLIGTDADHFTWTAQPEDPSLAGQENASQIEVSPETTTTYTMIGHGTNDCDALPQKKTVVIVPLPEPEVRITPGYIDSDDPTVSLLDASRGSVNSEWAFPDGEMAFGREVTHTFEDAVGVDSVTVILTTYNELNCPVEYPFSIPVSLFTAWFPNAFTPGSEDANALFSFFTVNDYEYFHIYIYNRRGELVYESDDVKFKWDGTRLSDGEPLPQGTYVYTCRYRKPGSTVLSAIRGTVTLIR